MDNERQVWPAAGWAEVPPDPDSSVECRIAGLKAQGGDRIRFVARRTGDPGADPILWDPVIVLR